MMYYCKKNLFTFFLIIFSLLAIQAYTQEYDPATDGPVNKKNKPSFKDKIFTGGNIGVAFGTITSIDISPLIGYRITDKIVLGVGGTYIYYSNKYYNYQTHIYGGRTFGRYYILENLFAHAEYEILNMEYYDVLLRDFSRKNVESILVGGGYRQSLGGKAAVNIMVLWNFNDTPESPYTNPIFRVGFDIGL